MRTTLILDDVLLREAKHRAAERDLTLSDVVNQALRDAFRHALLDAPPFSMVTYGPTGRRVTHEPADLAADLDEDDRRALVR